MIQNKIFLIILFNLFINISYAQDFKVSYYYDKSYNLTIEDIQTQQFKTIPKQYSLDMKKNTVWYKVELSNSSNKEKKLYLHNDISYMSRSIEIYELDNNILINKKSYNILDKDVSIELLGKSIVYPIMLDRDSKKIIYIKNQGLVYQLIDLKIYDLDETIEKSISSNFYSNIIVVILITLSLYNLMLYFLSKRKEFVFYFMYLFNCAIGLFYMYGSFYQYFNIFGEITHLFNITAILVAPLLALFIKYIFDINNQNKKLNIALNIVILVSMIDLLYALFFDLYSAMQLVSFVFLLSFIVVIYVGYNLYKKNHPLIKLFIIAYFLYIVGFSITVMGLMGVISFSTFTLHASGISLVLEGFIFAYMLSYRLKLLEIKVKEQQKDLLLKNKKEQFGEIIGNIAHQWRQPLNRINLNLAVIDDALKDEVPNKKIVLKKIESTQKNVHYMSDTIEDFINFYNPNKEKELFYVYDIVKKSINLLSNRTKDIEINMSIDEKTKVNAVPNEYLQVLLIILNNALDSFESQKIQNPRIDISLENIDDNLEISITDNGGGISKENIDKVFDPYFTTKFKKEGTGLGLYMAKMIVEDSMSGSLGVNTHNGTAIFKIILKNDEVS